MHNRPSIPLSLAEHIMTPAIEERTSVGEHKILVEKPEGADEGAPLWSGVATLGATALGVGILSMPICMHYAGWMMVCVFPLCAVAALAFILLPATLWL